MGTNEILLWQAKSEGLEQGIEKGIEQGIERGIKQGIKQGIERGIKQGIKQGIERGEELFLKNNIAQKLDKGLTIQEIADRLDIGIDRIIEIINKFGLNQLKTAT